MKLITVYARREVTTDSATKQMYAAQGRPNAFHQHQDVQIYRDRRAKKRFARFGWFMSNCPTRRNKYVTLNCYRWRLEWLPN